MKIITLSTPELCGRSAAVAGAGLLRQAIRKNGRASIIVATGASQFEMLKTLLCEPGIAWEKVTVFHLDEYIGLPVTHPASFRRYLWHRFHSRLPVPPKAFHYICGEGATEKECQRLSELISRHEIDVCFAGAGENAHLAFNDPPANFTTTSPYIIVNLDEACRHQQLSEGWFSTLEKVPRQAISMSIFQIMKSRSIIITAPEKRKSCAIRDTAEGPVTPLVPGSILQNHPDVQVFLDTASAMLLRVQAEA